MTVLSKDQNVSVIVGQEGQEGTAAVPAKSGYYTTIQVATTQLISTSTSITSSTSTVSNDFDLRAATYDEIVTHLWPGTSDQLCGIAAYILETINNTELQFTSLKNIYGLGVDYGMLTVAYVPEQGGVGIAHVSLKLGGSKPETKANPAYTLMHPSGTPFSEWLFEDYYNCTVVNGVEEITAL